MTEKQQKFADYYIQLGNATAAALKAGYSEKNVGENAAKTLKNPKVSAYISERLEEMAKQRVADATEVLEFYTSVMRGQVRDQFGLDASLADRLKAGDALMKRWAAGGYKYGESRKEMDALSKALKEEAERMQNAD